MLVIFVCFGIILKSYHRIEINDTLYYFIGGYMDYNDRKRAVNNLLKKYDKPFEIKSYLAQTWGMPTEQWHVCSKDSLETFTVYGLLLPEGYKLSDNYEPLSKLQHFKADAQRYASSMFGSCQVMVNVGQIVLCISDTKEDTKSKASAYAEKIANKYNNVRIKFVYNMQESEQEDVLLGEHESTIYYIGNDNTVKHLQVFPKYLSSEAGKVLSKWQIERLCSIVYLDELLHVSPYEDLGEVLLFVKEMGLTENLPCEMTKDDWMRVINSILDDDNLSRLYIVDFEDISVERFDVLPGHRAFCFMDMEDNAYVIFRGTSGDLEWADNGHGMIQSDTIQQEYSLKYAVRIRERFKPKILTVAGHSKGGNKAQYVAITAPDNLIDGCVSLDGQGFSLAFHLKYAQNIQKRKNIILLAEQRDFVNCLGIPIGATAFYRGFRGDKTPNYPNGYPLPFFHCPDALRPDSCSIGEEFSYSIIGAPINRFIVKFLTDKAYAEHRIEIIDHVITLMMQKKTATNKEIATALANLTILFIDMTAKSKDFDKELAEVVLNEPDVIIATIDSAMNLHSNQNESSLLDLYIQEFVEILLSRPSHILNLIVVLGKTFSFIIEMSKEKSCNNKLFLYILDIICTMLEDFIKKGEHKLISKKLLKECRQLIDDFNSHRECNKNQFEFMSVLNDWKALVADKV